MDATNNDSNMPEITALYKNLLLSNEGDIIVKLKDGKQIKIISYLVKSRSTVFKSMMNSSVNESTTSVIDFSSQYSLEAFRKFTAFIYYNEKYEGPYLPLMFEILSIVDYYDIQDYRTYIHDRIVTLITNVPICLTIASESLTYGALTEKIYTECVKFLVETIKWKNQSAAPESPYLYSPGNVFGSPAGSGGFGSAGGFGSSGRFGSSGASSNPTNIAGCVSTSRATAPTKSTTGCSETCHVHCSSRSFSINLEDLPEFIAEDVKSALADTKSKNEKNTEKSGLF
ncbi:hypothetical protein FBU30_001141 [Linnemannia zychae]|nr:hypothetical protein FBU30_001141 [Linnemannia zychae]